MSVPKSLHRVAELLNVPKYCYISTTTGYVVESDSSDEEQLLPKYGTVVLAKKKRIYLDGQASVQYCPDYR